MEATCVQLRRLEQLTKYLANELILMEATCVQLRRLRDKKRHAPPRHTEACCAGSHADAAVAMPE